MELIDERLTANISLQANLKRKTAGRKPSRTSEIAKAEAAAKKFFRKCGHKNFKSQTVTSTVVNDPEFIELLVGKTRVPGALSTDQAYRGAYGITLRNVKNGIRRSGSACLDRKRAFVKC